jgi:hypothetical protein
MRGNAAEAFDRSMELMAIALRLQQRARIRRRRNRPEIRGASDRASAEEQLSAVVRAGHPEVYCFTCLGIALELPESKVREAAQLMVLQDGFRVEHHQCFHCGRSDHAIIVEDGA